MKDVIQLQTKLGYVKVSLQKGLEETKKKIEALPKESISQRALYEGYAKGLELGIEMINIVLS